jgi:two-component system sensor histidine kinase MprB
MRFADPSSLLRRGERFVFRGLSFRGRLTLVAAVAVAATTIAASIGVYFFVEHVLVDQIDTSLAAHVEPLRNLRLGPGGTLHPQAPPPKQVLGGAGAYVQAFDSNGQVYLPPGETTRLPVGPDDLAVAQNGWGEYYHNGWVGDVHMRLLTVAAGSDGGTSFAVLAGRPLDEVDSILGALRIGLIALDVAAVVLAALLGGLVARAALAPVNRLTRAAEHVTQTGDLSQHVPDEGGDELGRLGANFNRMLDALDSSLRSQRQLVADASHELRTPLTSMRTNVEVLQRSPDLNGAERGRLMADLVSQSEQLSGLVHDLIDLAREDQPLEVVDDVALDALVRNAVEKAAAHWPQVHFATEIHETSVRGEPGRIERAVNNLLDNAGKWSPAAGTVEVRVADGEVWVRDHGPGIDRQDLPYVFDRFWRAPNARGMTGSGLGLAIVKQVAEAHGGTVRAELPPSGGTLMRLRLAAV